ncbi:MAG TPA: hypothetical protein VGN20_03610 [Mucilaginibacter sp.]|jgi:hypothetical protein
MAVKALATALQKENFKAAFADIVKSNDTLNNKYSIQFFDSPTKSNYVINGLDGKSINVIQYLSIEELDRYRTLKNHWRD